MPLSSQVHRSAALENISVAFKTGGLIAAELSPMVPVLHETDVYHVYSRDSLILPETARANGAEANRASWSISTSTYTLEEHALKDLVTDRDRRNADPAIKLDIDLTEYLTEKILMRQEVDLATLVGTAANWANTTSLSTTQAWSQNTTLSSPLGNADSAASVITQNSGKKPNVCAMDDRTFRAAKEHTSTVQRIMYTSAQSVTPDLLASLFGVERVLVASGIQNTGAEGLSETMAFIWTDMAFFAYVERSPGLKKPSALYTFTQAEGGMPYKVTQWREDSLDGDMVQVSKLFQNRAVASACAYQIVNTVQ